MFAEQHSHTVNGSEQHSVLFFEATLTAIQWNKDVAALSIQMQSDDSGRGPIPRCYHGLALEFGSHVFRELP